MITRLFTFLTLVAMCVYSLEARSIKGAVLSEADSTAIAGAICYLTAGGKTLHTTATASDGTFTFNTDSKNALTLQVQMTGYTPTEIIIDQGRHRSVNLGNIYLNEGVALNELTVTERSIINTQGRTVVYPSAYDVKSSATAIGMLQKLPLAGLDINPVNRTMTVDGAAPMILIDGVPSSLDDVHALQPKDIARIEYSRITPARYADRGVNGLISITLKKRNDGGEVYAWARSAVATAFIDGNIRASYHQGSSQLSIAYNPSWRNYQKVYDTTSEKLIAPDYNVYIASSDRNPFNYLYTPLKAKYNFTPDNHTLFSATVNVNTLTNHSRRMGDADDSVLGTYRINNETSGKDLSSSVDLFLRHDFNSRSTIEAQIVGTIGINDYHRTNIYDITDSPTQTYMTNVDNRRQSLISEISYIHNLNDRTSLSAGYQNTVSHNTNEYLTSDYKARLTENNNYIYIRYGQRIDRFYLSIASGAKMFRMTNDCNRRHFIRNLTTIQLSYRINSMWNLQGMFRYSPSIPSLASLTDYPQQTSPYLIDNGNPSLKVTNNFTYQLIPGFRYKKLSTTLLLSHYISNNPVVEHVAYQGDGLFLKQSVNANHLKINSANLSVKINNVAGFGASVNLNLAHYKSTVADWSHQLTSISGNFNVWWNRGPFTATYWRKLTGKYLNGYYIGQDENGDAISLEYKPSKHWTVGAMWMYMFEHKGTRYPSWNYSAVNPSITERHISNNANMVVLSLSYTTNFGSIFRTGKRSLHNADSTSSLLKL